MNKAVENKGNGMGPWWLPKRWCKRAAAWASFFFQEANWDIHDASYSAAFPARAICDRGLLRAMLRDVSLQDPVWRIAVGTVLAWVLWALVRLGGWASYGHR